MPDSAKTLWNKLRKMIHDLSKTDTSIGEELDAVISNLRNAASILAYICDPPLITKDYMYNIVELAKSISITQWYVDNVVEGRIEFIPRLKEESDNIARLTHKLYYSYKNRFKLLIFYVLTPLIIAGLDVGVMDIANTLYVALVLGLAGLSVILLPISTRGHSLTLMALSFTSMFIISQVVEDALIRILTLLYSIIGVVSGFTAYYASGIRDKLRTIVGEILSSRSVEVAKAAEESGELKEVVSEAEIYEKLLHEYRKLYGTAAKEILDYRVGLLLRSGFSRRRALEELAKELNVKIDRNKT